MKRVEVLFFDECPGVGATLDRVCAAIDAAQATAHVALVRVASDAEAARLRFLGSHTVRVDDVDVEPSAAEREDFGVQRRVYVDGAPPPEWIARALRG